MELVNYLTQIIVSVGIFIILCFIGEQIKKIIFNHSHKADFDEYLPKEEILTLKQVLYLVLIMFIYISIINFFYVRFFEVNSNLLLINSIIDIIVATTVAAIFYDGTTRSRILCILIMPLVSISYLVFGESLLGYWNFIRIPILLYVVIKLYHRFIEYTEENRLEKLILILISIVFTCLVVTIIVENQNPINSLGMVSNAFTSNGYAVLGGSPGGVLTSTFLVWSGYIISGVGTATLAAAIVHRNSKRKFEKLEEKIDNLERILVQYQDENKKEKKE